MAGIVWPLDGKGLPSSSAVGKRVFCAAMRAAGESERRLFEESGERRENPRPRGGGKDRKETPQAPRRPRPRSSERMTGGTSTLRRCWLWRTR